MRRRKVCGVEGRKIARWVVLVSNGDIHESERHRFPCADVDNKVTIIPDARVLSFEKARSSK